MRNIKNKNSENLGPSLLFIIMTSIMFYVLGETQSNLKQTCWEYDTGQILLGLRLLALFGLLGWGFYFWIKIKK
jgi:hypothetical protein